MSGIAYKINRFVNSAVLNTKCILNFPKRVFEIRKIIEGQSYYPEMKRKSSFHMWMDNFIWLLKNGELNHFYTSYGLDIEDFRDSKEFLPLLYFVSQRNKGNQNEKLTISGNYNSIVMLRDKYLFSSYLSSTIGEDSVVKTIALIDKGKAYDYKKKVWTDPIELLQEGSRYVYKTVDGECADGVYLVEVHDEKAFVNGVSYAKSEFIERFLVRRMLVQNVIEQHVDIARFKTNSANTIRIITIRGGSGTINVFAAFLRLAADKDSFVDNRAVGGFGVGIELENGKLMKYGFQHEQFGSKKEEHPISHIRFEGYQLPYWKETVELVANAHKQFYDIQSIGWDVVITNNGPVLLEGNDDWEIGGPQDTYGGLKKRWSELINA